MKSICVSILILAGIFAWPLVNEGSADQCGAVEKLALRIGTNRGIPANILQAFSGGKLAELLARGQYPDLPPWVACTYVYWKATFDSRSLEPAAIKPAVW